MSFRILLWKNKSWESKGSNLGDLAIIKAIIESLKLEMPKIEISLLSDDPNYTSNLYGINSKYISISSIINEVRRSNMIIIGGGTVFTDISSIAVIPINTLVPILGILFCKPIAAWGIGSGQKSLLGRLLIRLIMPFMRIITVRDEETKEDLSSIYPPAINKIQVTEDAVFSLQKKEFQDVKLNRIVIAPRRIFHYNKGLLPFYLRRKYNLLPKGYFEKMEDFKNIIAAVADYAVEKYDASITFLPMYSALGDNYGISGYFKSKFSSRDDIICQDILNRMLNKEYGSIFVTDDPTKVINYLAKSRFLLGVPLHSLMLACIAEIPFVALSYQEKVSRFVNRIGMERFMIHLEGMHCPLSYEEFIDKIDLIYDEEANIIADIVEFKNKIDKKANLPASMIADFFA